MASVSSARSQDTRGKNHVHVLAMNDVLLCQFTVEERGEERGRKAQRRAACIYTPKGLRLQPHLSVHSRAIRSPGLRLTGPQAPPRESPARSAGLWGYSPVLSIFGCLGHCYNVLIDSFEVEVHTQSVRARCLENCPQCRSS